MCLSVYARGECVRAIRRRARWASPARRPVRNRLVFLAHRQPHRHWLFALGVGGGEAAFRARAESREWESRGGLLPRASCLVPPASCLLPRASCLLPPASCLLPPASSEWGRRSPSVAWRRRPSVACAHSTRSASLRSSALPLPLPLHRTRLGPTREWRLASAPPLSLLASRSLHVSRCSMLTALTCQFRSACVRPSGIGSLSPSESESDESLAVAEQEELVLSCSTAAH